MTPRKVGRHVAYLRLSVDDKSKSEDEERAVQTSTVRRLAGPDHPPEILDKDWGISGSHEALRRREAFRDLTASIMRDEVAAVYVARLDRLSRDKRDLEDFIITCQEHGTRIVSGDGEVKFDTANQRLSTNMQGLVNQHERELTKERIQDGVARYIEAGNSVGTPPYGMRHVLNADGIRVLEVNPVESVDVLLAAVREGGGYNAGARLLNARGIRTRRGKVWAMSSLYAILQAQRPDAVDARRERGPARSKLHGRGIFRRMLRCTCEGGQPTDGSVGRWMTPKVQRQNARASERKLMSYICNFGRSVADHPRPMEVSELRVLDWARTEVGLFLTEQYEAPKVTVDVAALEGRRKRALDAFLLGVMTREELAAEQVAIAEAQSVGTARVATGRLLVSAFDWDRPDPEVNTDLRSIFRSITYDPATRELTANPWIDDSDADLRGLTSDELRAMGRRGDAP